MAEQKIDKVKLQRRLLTRLISTDAFKCLLEDNFAGFMKEREKTIREEFAKLVVV